MEVIEDGRDILIATERGYGKRVGVDGFRIAHRGGYGVRTIPTDKRNGLVIGLAQVSDMSNILLIDTAGKIIRLSPTEIRTMGRQAKGVRLIRLDKDQILSTVVSFEEDTSNPEAEDDSSHQATIDPQKAEVSVAPAEDEVPMFDFEIMPDTQMQLDLDGPSSDDDIDLH